MERASQPLGPLRIGVHAWAILTTLATFGLLCSGGIVTSKGVGMAVPDWPTTYGYNMFLFPIDRWVGGIFYEHTHRLVASGVGLLTMILAGWLLAVETRRWVKVLGIAAFVAVCLQGLLGGLRVTLYKDEIGIFHALLAQSFFSVLAILSVVTSPRFIAGRWDVFAPDGRLRAWAVATTVLIFVQLGLGATMRHEHAGLAIPDFPLAYGSVLPDTSPAAIDAINAQRAAGGEMPTHALFIWIQMAHRFLAVVILASVVHVAVRAWKTAGDRSIRAWAAFWMAMIFIQAGLGAWTIWSHKAADVATAHMALGALSLMVGVLLSFRLLRAADLSRAWAPEHTSVAGFA